MQHLDTGGSFWTWSAGTGPWLGASITVVDPVVMLVTAGVDGLLLRRDGRRQLLFSPNASIGLAVAFFLSAAIDRPTFTFWSRHGLVTVCERFSWHTSNVQKE